MLWVFGVLLLPALSAAVSVNADLKSTFYLSASYKDDGTPEVYKYNSKLVSMIAVDEKNKLVYSIGTGIVTVLGYDDNVDSLSYLAQAQVPGIMKKVAVCRSNVYITTKEGNVVIYRGYNKETKLFKLLNIVSVGPVPTHFQLYNGCSKLIIAQQGYLVQEAGKIVILNFTGGIKETPTVTELTFDAFLPTQNQLMQKGFVKNGAAFTQPKWVSINNDETKAYVSMRMNNAIAVVDLVNNKIISLNPLGFKDWSARGNTDGFDGNSDKTINIQNSPVLSVYDPDNLEYVKAWGKEFLFTANAGSNKIIGLTTLSELKVEPSLEQDKAAALQTCPSLSVLSAENVATDDNGLAKSIVTIGGRSISIFDASDFSVVGDTGSGIENAVEANFPEGFNANAGPKDTLSDVFDTTSTTSGPGVESLTTAKICDGNAVLVVAAARFPGTLHVYTVDKVTQAFEEQAVIDGYLDKSKSVIDKNLYTSFKLNMKDISTLKLFEGSDGALKLLVGSRKIDTINFFEISVTC